MCCIQSLSESFILGFEHFLQNQLNLYLFIDDVIKPNIELLNSHLNVVIDYIQLYLMHKNGNLDMNYHLYLSTFLHLVFSENLYCNLLEVWCQGPFDIESCLANIEFFKFSYFKSVAALCKRKTQEFVIIKQFLEQSVSLLGTIYASIEDRDRSEALKSCMRNNQIYFADELLLD